MLVSGVYLDSIDDGANSTVHCIRFEDYFFGLYRGGYLDSLDDIANGAVHYFWLNDRHLFSTRSVSAEDGY